jgi:hypothetical protein
MLMFGMPTWVTDRGKWPTYSYSWRYMFTFCAWSKGMTALISDSVTPAPALATTGFFPKRSA